MLAMTNSFPLNHTETEIGEIAIAIAIAGDHDDIFQKALFIGSLSYFILLYYIKNQTLE